MSASGVGTMAGLFLVGAVVVVGMIDDSHYTEGDALVTQIDRKCSFVTPASKKTFEEDCNFNGKFDALRDDPDRKKVEGHGEAVVLYTSPRDGSQLVGRVKLDSGDDKFYSLRANDKLRIDISKEDPTKIRVA